jgi:hypothetical protein
MMWLAFYTGRLKPWAEIRSPFQGTDLHGFPYVDARPAPHVSTPAGRQIIGGLIDVRSEYPHAHTILFSIRSTFEEIIRWLDDRTRGNFH